MRTSFVTGFIKTSLDLGLTEGQAVILLKNALDHPAALEMFSKMAEETGPELSSGELEWLSAAKQTIESGRDIEIFKEAIDSELKSCAS